MITSLDKQPIDGLTLQESVDKMRGSQNWQRQKPSEKVLDRAGLTKP